MVLFLSFLDVAPVKSGIYAIFFYAPNSCQLLHLRIYCLFLFVACDITQRYNETFVNNMHIWKTPVEQSMHDMQWLINSYNVFCLNFKLYTNKARSTLPVVDSGCQSLLISRHLHTSHCLVHSQHILCSRKLRHLEQTNMTTSCDKPCTLIKIEPFRTIWQKLGVEPHPFCCICSNSLHIIVPL